MSPFTKGRMLQYFLLLINSNLGRISHRFQDMDSFLLKNKHFSYPYPLNPQFENVPLADG